MGCMMSQVTTIHSDKQIDALSIINFLQFGCASGFNKNYASKLSTEKQKHAFLNTVNFMISDLSQSQLQTGVIKLRDSGFCPDLNLFRRWCLGLDGFDTAEDKIRKTYLGSDSALAHIINYSKQQSDFITNAMELAYTDTMQMFVDLNTSDKPEYLVFQIYKSFKSCYEDHVKKLVHDGIVQKVLNINLGIENKKPSVNSEYRAHAVNHRPYG